MWTETQRAPSTIIASRGKVGRNLRKCLWAYSSDRSGRNVTWDRNVSHVNANYLPPTLPNRWRQKEQSIVDIILPVSVLSLLSHFDHTPCFRRLFLCKHDATATKTEVHNIATPPEKDRVTSRDNIHRTHMQFRRCARGQTHRPIHRQTCPSQ